MINIREPNRPEPGDFIILGYLKERIRKEFFSQSHVGKSSKQVLIYFSYDDLFGNKTKKLGKYPFFSFSTVQSLKELQKIKQPYREEKQVYLLTDYDDVLDDYLDILIIEGSIEGYQYIGYEGNRSLKVGGIKREGIKRLTRSDRNRNRFDEKLVSGGADFDHICSNKAFGVFISEHNILCRVGWWQIEVSLKGILRFYADTGEIFKVSTSCYIIRPSNSTIIIVGEKGVKKMNRNFGGKTNNTFMQINSLFKGDVKSVNPAIGNSLRKVFSECTQEKVIYCKLTEKKDEKGNQIYCVGFQNILEEVGKKYSIPGFPSI